MTAPVFLLQCPRCFGLHPWRPVASGAATVHRIVPHWCQHGNQCIADCSHGKPMLSVHTKDGADVREDGSNLCLESIPSCAQCIEIQNQVYAKPLPSLGCLVCREVKRQGGSGCPGFKTSTENGWTYAKPDPLCKWRKLERMPPWCAGSTDTEQQAFIGAIPSEKREKAIEEARKANHQEGAKQEREAPKKVEKKRDKGQTSMF